MLAVRYSISSILGTDQTNDVFPEVTIVLLEFTDCMEILKISTARERGLCCKNT